MRLKTSDLAAAVKSAAAVWSAKAAENTYALRTDGGRLSLTADGSGITTTVDLGAVADAWNPLEVSALAMQRRLAHSRVDETVLKTSGNRLRIVDSGRNSSLTCRVGITGVDAAHTDPESEYTVTLSDIAEASEHTGTNELYPQTRQIVLRADRVYGTSGKGLYIRSYDIRSYVNASEKPQLAIPSDDLRKVLKMGLTDDVVLGQSGANVYVQGKLRTGSPVLVRVRKLSAEPVNIDTLLETVEGDTVVDGFTTSTADLYGTVAGARDLAVQDSEAWIKFAKADGGDVVVLNAVNPAMALGVSEDLSTLSVDDLHSDAGWWLSVDTAHLLPFLKRRIVDSKNVRVTIRARGYMSVEAGGRRLLIMSQGVST